MRNYRAHAAAFLTMFSVLPAFAQSTGITDTTIKLGTTAVITGPFSGIGMIADGIDLKFKAVNAAGGVKMGDGKTRKIEFIITDDAGEPPRSLNNVRRLVEQDGIFALVGVIGTAQAQAIKPYIGQKKVPNLFVYSLAYEFGDENVHPMSTPLVPSTTTEAAIHVEYLKRVRPNAKVGILYINNDFGLNYLAGFKEAIKGSNIQLADAQANNPSDPTVDTQLTNLKASGADTLMIPSLPRSAVQSIRFGAESGWKPLILISYAASSPVALKAAGVDNLQGVVTAQFMKPIASKDFADDPGVKRYLSAYETFKPRFDRGDTFGQMGYLIGDAAVSDLQSMKEPTRQTMLDIARHMKNVELDLLLPGVKLNTNGKDDPFPIETMQLFVFKGDGYVPTGDAISYEGKTPRL